MKIKIVKSKRGTTCLWESGGGCRTSGCACLVCGPNGEPKRPIYVKKEGHLSNGEHALIPIDVGDLSVTAGHAREDFYITLDEIKEIEGESAVIKTKFEFNLGEWTPADPPENLAAVIKAAKDKALCYHCREPYFIISQEVMK